jgi:cytochrome c556
MKGFIAPALASVLASGLAIGCGGASVAQPTAAPAAKSLHSPELNRVMKEEVNQPYSALVFLVFHGEGELDYGATAAPSETLRGGISKVRYIAELPTETSEARAVFFTYLDNLALDAERFRGAVLQRDKPGMGSALSRIGKTCNSCHHFFRLEIHDTPEE